MNSELTNLVPMTQRKAFRTEYFIRLSTVGVLLLAALIFIQGVFLLPSYLYERAVVSMRTQGLQKLSTNAATSEEKDAQSRQQALAAESTYLLSLKGAGTASMALRAILAVPHPGITISGLAFQQGGIAAPRKLQLTGIATTRETLRAFDAALSALPYVSNADLPISSYAKDTSIPFTITLTGTLQP